MKSKKTKHFEDVIDEYIVLLDEQIELPIVIQKANDKLNQHLIDDASYVYKPGETEDMFKIFMQTRKYQERKAQLDYEIAEVENTLKDFLSSIKGGKIAYAKKDDTEKSKSTFLFWLENEKIMSNR